MCRYTLALILVTTGMMLGTSAVQAERHIAADLNRGTSASCRRPEIEIPVRVGSRVDAPSEFGRSTSPSSSSQRTQAHEADTT
jgi:hypothetical protein